MDMIWEYLSSIGAILIVVFVVGFCIFSHELGHFLAGKWRKLHIDAFSIGFRKIWGKTVDGIEYRIGWLPLGGYVELPQVDATTEEIKAADGTVLPRAKPLDRIITAAAGPLANILCGMVLACFVWYFGLPQDTPNMKRMTVASVSEDSPEYKAGLRKGDVVVSLNGKPFHMTWAKFAENIMYTVGPVQLGIERDGQLLEIEYTPVDNPNAPGRLGREKIGYPFFTVEIPLELNPVKGGPADRAGIRKGDVLLFVDKKQVNSALDLQQLLATSETSPVEFQIRRDGKILTVPVVPEMVPGAQAAYKIGIALKDTASGPEAEFVFPHSAAQQAGILAGDVFKSLDGKPVTDSKMMIGFVNEHGATPLQVTVERKGEVQTFRLVPQKRLPRSVGVELMTLSYPTPFEQFNNIFLQTFKAMRGMVVSGANAVGLTEKTSTLKPRHMSGPLGIGTVLYGMFRRAPIMMAIHFVVVFMFALAIFNLLPLPVLDGGHITFALIEIVFRRPLPTVVIRSLSMVFIGLLVLLMLYVTYFDVLRLLPVRKAVKENVPVQKAKP